MRWNRLMESESQMMIRRRRRGVFGRFLVLLLVAFTVAAPAVRHRHAAWSVLDAEQEQNRSPNLFVGNRHRQQQKHKTRSGKDAPPVPSVEGIQLPKELQRPGFEAVLEFYWLESHPTTVLRRKKLEYEGEVWVGTPRQPLHLTLDTGKAFTWVVDVRCKAEDLGSLVAFDRQKSSTWKAESGWAQVQVTDDKLQIPESDDDERGEDEQNSDVLAVRGTDTLSLSFDLTLREVPMGVGTEAEGTYPDKFDHAGVVGLGFPVDLPKLKGSAYVPLADGWQLYFEGDTSTRDPETEIHPAPDPIFGFYLAEEGGCVQWGGYNPPLYYKPGTLKWFPARHKATSWTIRLSDILVDGKSLGLCPKGRGCPAAIHTGEGRITGPPEKMIRLMRAVQVDPMCLDLHLLPKLTFVLEAGEVSVDFTGEDYAGRQPNPEDPEMNECTGIFALQQVDAMPDQTWILGASFLRRLYTVYDVKNQMIGFAEPDHTHYSLNRCEYEDWALRIRAWKPIPGYQPPGHPTAVPDRKPTSDSTQTLISTSSGRHVSPLDAQLRSGIRRILDANDPIDRVVLNELDSRHASGPPSLLEASHTAEHAQQAYARHRERRGAGLSSRMLSLIDRRIDSAERAIQPYIKLSISSGRRGAAAAGDETSQQENEDTERVA